VARRPETGTLDVGRALPGRGAWLCADSKTCLDQAARKGALGRALRADVTAQEIEALRVALTGCARMEGRSQSEMEGK
jgi:predicted RNA-binding protein YlxR (DUF448 family)